MANTLKDKYNILNQKFLELDKKYNKLEKKYNKLVKKLEEVDTFRHKCEDCGQKMVKTYQYGYLCEKCVEKCDNESECGCRDCALKYGCAQSSFNFSGDSESD